MLKMCVDCKLMLSVDEFYNSKVNKGGKSTACKGCYYIRQRASVAKNSDRVKQYKIAYKEKNKERLRQQSRERKQRKIASMTPEELAVFRKKRLESKRIHRALKYGSGGRHSESEWRMLLEICGQRCLACGTFDKLTRDHIVPLSNGGHDGIMNIQPLCWSCNSSKNRHHSTDYRSPDQMKLLESFTDERPLADRGGIASRVHHSGTAAASVGRYGCDA